LADKFSHIYIEENALSYPLAQKALYRFKNAVKVEIGHYKDVFCRPNQDFQLQKRAQNLILAVKKDNFIYKGPELCQNFGNPNFYYTSSLLNCVYNCDYCYLQGMYPSANLVAFVNIEDFFAAVLKQLNSQPLYLAVSYDTDLLAFENVIPFTAMWIEFAAGNPDLLIEIRTKSAGYSSIAGMSSVSNVILAWTLSPDVIVEKYEKQTPALSSRLSSIKQAIADGWKVRLCFDPVIKAEGWKKIYEELVDEVFLSLPPDKIYDVGIGPFRMSADYLKRIRKSRYDSDLIYYPFECRNGIAGYAEEAEKELVTHVYSCVNKYINRERIYL